MTALSTAAAPPVAASLPSWLPVSARLEGGTLDCGSGLLLLVMRTVRGVAIDDVLVISTQERSVVDDLPAWARLAGHAIVAVAGADPRGP